MIDKGGKTLNDREMDVRESHHAQSVFLELFLVQAVKRIIQSKNVTQLFPKPPLSVPTKHWGNRLETHPASLRRFQVDKGSQVNVSQVTLYQA